MTKPAETTVVEHWVQARWDDYFSEKTERFGHVIWPSRLDALFHAASEARLKGAPSQALVFDQFDASYLIDMVVVRWRTPVGTEQPEDITRVNPEDVGNKFLRRTETISRRLGDIPR